MSCNTWASSGVRRKKIRGVHGRGFGLVGGPGGGAPRTAENFRNFAKKFPKEIAKNVVFSPILQKNISKPCVNFSSVWTQNTIVWGKIEKSLNVFDENSMEKLNFFLFWEILLLKIESSELTSFFYNDFFLFGGGRFEAPNPPPPLRTPLASATTIDIALILHFKILSVFKKFIFKY